MSLPYPAATTCFLPSFSHSTGVQNPLGEARFVSHRFDPSAASRARTFDSLRVSRTSTTSPSARMGETPVPKSAGVSAVGRSYFHSRLPAVSWANTPHDPKYDTTTVPSVATLDAAGLPSVLWYASTFLAGASARHSSLPSAVEYATVYSLPSSNAVRNSLSPATTGDEKPDGTGTFHFRFLSGPNSTGGFSPSPATPLPFGPRNCGHFGASAAHPAPAPAASAPPNTPTATRFMRNP